VQKLRRIQHSIASGGLRRTLADLASMAFSMPSLAYNAEDDSSFDVKFGTDTSGSVQPAELGIADPAVRKKAIRYLASPPHVTRWMLRNVGVEPGDFTCVDVGCGKGRVLLLASELPFRQVVGVEISMELCAVARRNAAIFRPSSRRSEIEVRNADATQLDFPRTNLLIHMYHPFDPELTARFLEQLGRSLAVTPRKIVVAYLLYTAAVPAVEAVFASVPWLRRTRYERSLTGQYDWLFFTSDFAGP